MVSAEVYDPSTDAWSVTGSMAQSRAMHTATLLEDGSVLVAGGIGERSEGRGVDVRTLAEVYDPTTGDWSSAASTAEARAAHTATLFDDGRVLVTGGGSFIFEGFGGLLATAEIYYPSTKRWSSRARMSQTRIVHSATLIAGGTVLVAGGSVGEEDVTALSSAEVYVPTTGDWLSVIPTPTCDPVPRAPAAPAPTPAPTSTPIPLPENVSLLAKWGSSGSGEGQLASPRGIAVDGSGNVYVVDAGNNRIQVFSTEGEFLRKWSEVRPRGIAVDGSGDVYVTSSCQKPSASEVQVFNSGGDLLRRWRGVQQHLNNPQGIAVDAIGNVYVADTGNNKLRVFTSSGEFLRK